MRLRTYVGPIPPRDTGGVDLGTVPATAVRDWLLTLARRGPSRVARDAIVPLLVVDGPLPWPALLALARDDQRPSDVRRQAIFWLAEGASARVDPGTGDTNGTRDDDDVRKSAVFALSRERRDVAVPALIDLATTNARGPVRASALFWLGQTGDPRGLPVFAKVLGLVP